MKFLSANGSSVVSDAIISVFLVLLAVGCIIGAIVLLCRFSESDGKAKHTSAKMAVILSAGFVLRLIFSLCIRGYRGDYTVFSAMFSAIETKGVAGYYGGDASAVLYPVVFLVYLPFAALSNVAGLSFYGLGMQFMIKLPLMIADLLAAFAVYKIADRYFNKNIALILCAFVCVCPIFFVGSSIWCTPITFTVMFLCFSCYFLARKNYALTVAFATAAAFSGKEGIYIFPVVCVFSCYHFVRAVINISRGKAEDGVAAVDRRAAVTVPVGFIASLIGAYLIGLIMIKSYDPNPFGYIYEFVIAPLTEWKYFTFDGLSIYAVFGRNGSIPGARFPAWLFVIIFFAILTAVVCIVYFTKRNRATMVMLAAFSLLTMQVYYPGTSAPSMQSTLLILLAAYALVRDKRILTVLFAVGSAYLVNCITVMANAGQLNNLNEYDIETAAGGIEAVTVVCSVIAALAHLYFTAVTVSVGMTGQKRTLGKADGFGASIKEYFSVKKG